MCQAYAIECHKAAQKWLCCPPLRTDVRPDERIAKSYLLKTGSGRPEPGPRQRLVVQSRRLRSAAIRCPASPPQEKPAVRSRSTARRRRTKRALERPRSCSNSSRCRTMPMSGHDARVSADTPKKGTGRSFGSTFLWAGVAPSLSEEPLRQQPCQRSFHTAANASILG